MYVRTYQRTLFLDTCLRLTNPCKDPPVKGRPHTHLQSGSRSAEEFRTFSNAIHLNLLNQTYCGWKKSYTRWFLPLFTRVSAIQGGAGFLPSTVGHNNFD